MATTDKTLPLEIAHFDNFRKYLPLPDDLCDYTINVLLEMGLLQVSTAFEHAITSNDQLSVVSIAGSDFNDGSDAKLSSARTHGSGRMYGAPIRNVHTKIGSLRIQVYERKQQKFYYFVIPHDAYKHIPKSSNIEIPFEHDGTPRISNHWWNHEVGNFSLMCETTFKVNSELTEA